MAHDVFISYSSGDKRTADAVCRALEARRILCWIVPRDIRPGAAWAEALAEGIKDSRVFVLVFSRESNHSEDVFREISMAASWGIPIVAFRIHDVEPTRRMGYYLKPTQWLDASPSPLEKHLEHLADTVELALAESLLPSAAAGQEATGARPACPRGRGRPRGGRIDLRPKADPCRGGGPHLPSWPRWRKEGRGKAANLTPRDGGAEQTGESSAERLEVLNTDRVDFTLVSPSSAPRRSSFVVDVWAHRPEELQEVIARAHQSLAGKSLVTKGKPGRLIARGAEIGVRLEIPGLEIEEPAEVILWEGTMANADFVVTVPAGAAEGPRAGRVTLSVAGLRITRIAFTLVVTARRKGPDETYVGGHRPSSAFASYASDDRELVVGRLQGMQKIAPGMDIFVDVMSIRSGERWKDRVQAEITGRETFFLFWSQNAMHSPWVDHEWRFALKQRGLDFIDPVPLESPVSAPPPPELSALQFNDKWVAFARTAQPPC